VTASRRVRFGPFEFDPLKGDLLKEGHRQKLQPQPAKVLSLLVSRPGELVLREELEKAVWGGDTFVDFERGLNFAIRQVRAALGDDSESPKYVETFPRRGYRFIAEVDSANGLRTASPSDAVQKAGLRGAPLRRRKALLTVLLGCSVLLLTVCWINIKLGILKRAVTKQPCMVRSIAVLPLNNLSGDPEQEYFADGMTDEIITTLAQTADLQVISRSSVMRFKTIRKPLREIASELGVEDVIEGSVFRSGNHVRITAQLIHAPTDTHLWARSYERELQDVLRLQNEIAHSISAAVHATLIPPTVTKPTLVSTVDVEAYDNYLKGRYECAKRTPRALLKCAQLFERNVAKNPTYAKGFAGLSISYVLLGEYNLLPARDVFPKARAAATRALELDGTVAEGHSGLGAVLRDYDWDWIAAERESRRAIELNAADSTAHQWYAELLSEVLGRHEEALTEIKRAHELDMLSPIINTVAGRTLLFAGRREAAVQRLRIVLELDPNFPPAHFMLGNAYLGQNALDKAVQQFRTALTLAPQTSHYAAALANAYARQGNPNAARDLLKKLAVQSPRSYQPWFDRAAVYAGLGDADQAFACLDKAYAQHDHKLRWLRMEPLFENLHSDRRFRDLEYRLGLPQQ